VGFFYFYAETAFAHKNFFGGLRNNCNILLVIVIAICLA